MVVGYFSLDRGFYGYDRYFLFHMFFMWGEFYS